MRTNRFQVRIDALQAGIPSYTQLGMASLLPHDSLSIDKKTGDVLVDGKKVNGLAQREKVLSDYFQSRYKNKKVKAMQADDFTHLSLEQQEREIEGADLVYLFHNHIDAIGDNAKTETGLPGAVEEEISFLHSLCRKIANLNRTHIIITSDHGYLYQHTDIEEADTISIPVLDGEHRRNRRFLLGDDLPDVQGLSRISGTMVGLQDELDILVPQGLGRIAVKGGGRRFVHGGISLQELCVPLLTVRKSRIDDIGIVDIDVLKKGELITSGQITITFFQSQPVDVKMHPRFLLMRFEAPDGTLLSNSVEANFESSDPYDQNRSKSYTFTFTRDAARYNNSYITLKMYDKKEGGTLVYYNEFTYKYRTTVEKDFDF